MSEPVTFTISPPYTEADKARIVAEESAKGRSVRSFCDWGWYITCDSDDPALLRQQLAAALADKAAAYRRGQEAMRERAAKVGEDAIEKLCLTDDPRYDGDLGPETRRTVLAISRAIRSLQPEPEAK